MHHARISIHDCYVTIFVGHQYPRAANGPIMRLLQHKCRKTYTVALAVVEEG